MACQSGIGLWFVRAVKVLSGCQSGIGLYKAFVRLVRERFCPACQSGIVVVCRAVKFCPACQSGIGLWFVRAVKLLFGLSER